MSPFKTNLLYDVGTNFFPKMWVMGRGVPNDHENKDSRHCEFSLINRKQLKSKTYPLIFEAPKSTVC